MCTVLRICMHGSRNFHERGSNENGNFWSQTRGGPTPKKIPKFPFLGKIFKFQGGSGPPVPPSGSVHEYALFHPSHHFNPFLTNRFAQHYRLGESSFIFSGIKTDFFQYKGGLRKFCKSGHFVFFSFFKAKTFLCLFHLKKMQFNIS